MKKPLAIILVLIVFLLGVAAGALGAKLFVINRMHYALSSPQAMAQVFILRMSDELGLNTEQRQQLAPVIDDARRDLLKLRDRVQPQLEEIFERTDQRIRPLLKPDQLKRFEELSRLRKEHWAKHPAE